MLWLINDTFTHNPLGRASYIDPPNYMRDMRKCNDPEFSGRKVNQKWMNSRFLPLMASRTNTPFLSKLNIKLQTEIHKIQTQIFNYLRLDKMGKRLEQAILQGRQTLNFNKGKRRSWLTWSVLPQVTWLNTGESSYTVTCFPAEISLKLQCGNEKAMTPHK